MSTKSKFKLRFPGLLVKSSIYDVLHKASAEANTVALTGTPGIRLKQLS